MAKNLLFEVDRDGEVLIVSVAENVGSFADAEVLIEVRQILKQLAGQDVRGIVVDLRQAAYFGSSMLEALRELWNHVHHQGGKLALCNVSDVGRDILEVSRFNTLWPILDSRDEALKAVRLPS